MKSRIVKKRVQAPIYPKQVYVHSYGDNFTVFKSPKERAVLDGEIELALYNLQSIVTVTAKIQAIVKKEKQRTGK